MVVKRASIVELRDRKPMTVVMVEHHSGTRAFYTADGYPLVNVGKSWQIREVLGEFRSWDEFEELAGISPWTYMDNCPTCERMALYKGGNRDRPCVECRKDVELVNEMVN